MTNMSTNWTDPTYTHRIAYTYDVNGVALDEWDEQILAEIEAEDLDAVECMNEGRPTFTRKHYQILAKPFAEEATFLISHVTPIIEDFESRVDDEKNDYYTQVFSNFNGRAITLIVAINRLAWELKEDNERFNWEMFKKETKAVELQLLYTTLTSNINFARTVK